MIELYDHIFYILYIIGNSLEFEVHNKEAFEIPLGNVSHVTTSKNEVTLEFHQNDDAAVSLVEMRYHIPTEQNTESDPVEVCIEYLA